MNFPWGHRDAGAGRRPPMSKETMTSRYSDFQRMITDGKNLQAKGEEYMVTLRQWAREDGLAHELYALEHPRPPEAPKWEKTQRIRVVKPVPPTYAPNPHHGQEVYCAGVGAVVDWPISVVKRLGDCVELVPAGTELRHVPVPMPMA
jgi:hypothetical protein